MASHLPVLNSLVATVASLEASVVVLETERTKERKTATLFEIRRAKALLREIEQQVTLLNVQEASCQNGKD